MDAPSVASTVHLALSATPDGTVVVVRRDGVVEVHDRVDPSSFAPRRRSLVALFVRSGEVPEESAICALLQEARVGLRD